ncbi:hypothetical protein MBM_00415 [Drepanopeziza brunnea f. sp. 'multigermtubi' MB_m1]|uniref:Uncharacterized protein n=1 Tax=Marssonina brunnea f. sp. multigermtubi (strain MB_m1) TaxID=1072389 RepID=K1X8C1_MARBU|nr:uncharacterized protein MBM_00415 [Drepanopeziza brunnea f. sp. 'multigermtubi' MB_m1]EKD21302.1 hypothetical protein MBM_00415 [Drepanopeziza brunnea f. sp. 'multigermtubi' MB_m1]
MLPLQYLWPTVVALGFLVNRSQAEDVLIGYRTVSEAEALLINANNKPFRDKAFDDVQGLNQIGNGIYLVNTNGGWKGRKHQTKWYCYFLADQERLNKTEKVWVPKSYKKTGFFRSKTTRIWFEGEAVVAKYVKKIVKDANNAIRFSWLYEPDLDMEMLIPTEMVNNDALGLYAQCSQNRLELSYTEVVDWSSWAIAGDSGPYDYATLFV